jgi:acetyl esterase/lipase
MSVMGGALRWIAVVLALCSSADKADEPFQRYGPSPQQIILVCDPTKSAGRTSPGVLLIHGGGWISGAPQGFAGQCRSFASSGIAAAVVGYRLANALDSSTRWPAQADDVRYGLDYFLNHSKAVDPRRVCAYGQSSGGHIALWAGILDRRIACVLDAFGPTDLTTLGPRFDQALVALLGPDNDEARRKAASPAFNASNMPPIMIVHGLDDELVSVRQSIALLDALTLAKVPSVMVTHSGGHMIAQDVAHQQRITDQIVSFIRSAQPRKPPH